MQRAVAESLTHFVPGHRGLSGRDDRHRRALDRMPPDRRIDLSTAPDVACRQRQVLAANGARLQLADEIRLRRERLRNDQQTAGVLVETVNDARPRNPRKLRRVMQQRVGKRSVPVAAARMDDQAGGLVDDEQRIVLVHDDEIDRLRGKRNRFRIEAGEAWRRARRREACASRPRLRPTASRGPHRSTI